ncbi:MAG: hypothetical protein RTU30_06495 [Candidatus Thorarchaeota archaeon]
MLVAYTAASIVLVTVIISLFDKRAQKSRKGRHGQLGKQNYPSRNVWELTHISCDFGSAWAHTSGPARALNLQSERKHDSE